ncbi:MAG TPA: hypothetical protein VF954_00615 [Acidimicrobiales bacterium]
MGEALRRLLARDATLWPAGNVAANRLGWLDLPRRMAGEARELAAFAASVDQPKVVLLGMGGSSLGPEVLRASRPGPGRRLVVLDTTDPQTVAGVDLSDAFFLVSSKSGTTLEVQAHFAHAWAQVPDGSRYAAITDPGTPLAALAAAHGFRRTFENPPDIGGRYSVLSYFGLVPAALLGYDVAELCERALGTDLEDAAELGVAMGEAARQGRDKVTVVVPKPFRAFGLWVEQLIAESTGKRGTGCVPVPTTEVEEGPDRHVVALEIGTADDLAAEFYRWELATAIAGHVLGIDPFDEPNVAESKANTRQVLDSLPLPQLDHADPATVSDWLRRTVRPNDYVSVQAYLPYGHDDDLEELRRTLRDGLGGAAVTAGYGPRFLHSTGQLHKGGPDEVVAVQLVRRTHVPSVAIPGFPYDYDTLIAAQAIGDHRSLLDHGRRVLRVAVDSPHEVG